MIENEKIAEYLLSYYNLLEYAKMNKDVNISRLFDDLYFGGFISINRDEYEDMILTYFYSCIIKIFSFYKDYSYKGIEEKSLDNIYIDDSILKNKKVLDNFNKKDIVLFVRNALAHSTIDNKLYWFKKDDNGNLVIHISLKNVKASLGKNKGKITPFEITLNYGSLLSLASVLGGKTKSSHIMGISFKNVKAKEISKYYKDRDTLLRKLLDATYYYHNFYFLLSDKEKEEISQLDEENYRENYLKLLESKKNITKTKELSIEQKNTFYRNIKSRIDSNFVSDPYEIHNYETSKIIPVGILKIEALCLSSLRSLMFFNETTYNDVSWQMFSGLLNKKEHPYNTFSYLYSKYDNPDDRAKCAIFDSENDNNIALSLFLEYMLENIVSEDKVVIENKEYPRNRLRNAFVHGRWYISDKNWELYDWKKDEFHCDWHKAINIGSIRYSMIDYLYSLIQKKRKIR